MQSKGKVLNLRYFNKIFYFIRENVVLLTVSLVFIVGLCIGIFTYFKNDFGLEYSKNFIESFINDRSNKPFLSVLLNSLVGSLLYAVLLFACGSSVLGVALSPLVIILKGFFYGSVATHMYSQYSLNGIVFHTVLIMPSAIVFIISLLLLARESISFSLYITSLTLPTSAPQSLYFSFKNYCRRFFILCILILISSLVDAVISFYFISKFTL